MRVHADERVLACSEGEESGAHAAVGAEGRADWGDSWATRWSWTAEQAAVQSDAEGGAEAGAKRAAGQRAKAEKKTGRRGKEGMLGLAGCCAGLKREEKRIFK